MLILKHNTLTPDELFQIETKYLRWLDRNSSDIIDLNVLDCDHNDIYGILLGIFTKLEIPETLNLTPSTLLDFLIDIRRTYRDTPYHSFYHAADVVIVLYYIMTHLKAKKYLSNLEISVLFIAAICHDAGHTGYNNDYHVKLNTDLAIRFKNTSVLESLSVEIALELLKKHDILMTDNELFFKRLILSTDMQRHYDLLTEMHSLEDILSSVNLWDEEEQISFSNDSMFTTTTEPIMNPLDNEQRISFACVLLHAADISNTVRSWPISKQWSDLIVQEFFRQGDAEKLAGYVVSPGMDRDVATQASISIKFSDFVVRPYFEALMGLLPSASVFIDTLQENREEWLALKEGPFATSITSYFMLNQRRHVNVPAGTVTLPPDSSPVKPMPILRASSHNNVLFKKISPSASSELRRNSADYRKTPQIQI